MANAIVDSLCSVVQADIAAHSYSIVSMSLGERSTRVANFPTTRSNVMISIQTLHLHPLRIASSEIDPLSTPPRTSRRTTCDGILQSFFNVAHAVRNGESRLVPPFQDLAFQSSISSITSNKEPTSGLLCLVAPTKASPSKIICTPFPPFPFPRSLCSFHHSNASTFPEQLA